MMGCRIKLIKSGIYSVFLVWLIFTTGCRKEKLYTNRFSFNLSTDTLLFDTVFTRLAPGQAPPSVYEVLKIVNPFQQKVKTNIRLAGGVNSVFKLNVDGKAGTVFKDYELEAGDSFYIFVEAFLNQNNLNNPLVISDSIEFNNMGNLQYVKLVAWGQDAHYLSDTIISVNTTWVNDGKPWVLYNFVAVDYNTRLKIDPGVHIYCHNNVRFYVGGSVEINGDTNNRVIFEGDRLQWEYAEIPGQWVGIRFLPGSSGNIIKNCLIKNAIIGIEVDSVPVGNPLNLSIENTEIRNMSQVGMVGYTAWIKAVNCLISSCGQFTFAGIYGGNYDINHCTFVIYNNNIYNHKKPHCGFNNEVFRDENGVPVLAAPLTYSIRNSIIYGNLDDEFEIGNDASNPLPVNAVVTKNLIRSEKLAVSYQVNNKMNINPQFISSDKGNYKLSNSSPAIDYSDGNSPQYDISGAIRNSPADAGCYELK